MHACTCCPHVPATAALFHALGLATHASTKPCMLTPHADVAGMQTTTAPSWPGPGPARCAGPTTITPRSRTAGGDACCPFAQLPLPLIPTLCACMLYACCMVQPAAGEQSVEARQSCMLRCWLHDCVHNIVPCQVRAPERARGLPRAAAAARGGGLPPGRRQPATGERTGCSWALLVQMLLPLQLRPCLVPVASTVWWALLRYRRVSKQVSVYACALNRHARLEVGFTGTNLHIEMYINIVSVLSKCNMYSVICALLDAGPRRRGRAAAGGGGGAGVHRAGGRLGRGGVAGAGQGRPARRAGGAAARSLLWPGHLRQTGVQPFCTLGSGRRCRPEPALAWPPSADRCASCCYFAQGTFGRQVRRLLHIEAPTATNSQERRSPRLLLQVGCVHVRCYCSSHASSCACILVQHGAGASLLAGSSGSWVHLTCIACASNVASMSHAN